ncbi:MAG: tRNA dihydrouridine synthase DusB [Erysipelotrichaceae bacterium]|jgi:nifR3 family TIM-barrel protein|nr:tRNA dihydrouridine synthase DusB [Erysipelotrichaceae bacterium]
MKWLIGKTQINGPVVLAPMAGVTSFAYRNFMKKFGADVVVSEMVSDMGLIYQNEQTIEYLKSSNFERPFGIQLFGYDKENILKAAKIIAKTAPNYDFIDLNLGCPVPKVTRNGAGSALLKDPKKIGQIVKLLVDNIDVPVTAKIRLGIDDEHINFLEVIKELEDNGISMIAIHARTTKQLYSGKPNWDLLKGLGKKMKVPLIVSGDIYTLKDAVNAIDITNATGVMVARGGVGNPRLVSQISEYYKTGIKLPDASKEEQCVYALELAKMLISEKGEETAMRVYRSIGPKFFQGFANSKNIRTEIATKITTYKELEEAVKTFKDTI